MVVQLVQQHPMAASLIAVAAVATLCLAGWLWMRRSRRLAQQERTVAVTDAMSGSQFEHWVARLMRASGCRRVRVSGGSGDMGADVTGFAPDGHRLVVQCKRYRTKVGSPEVQRFAGTARHIHGAEVALLVTNSYLTAQAADVARRCHISVVDRDALGLWATSLTLPFPPATGGPATSALMARIPATRRLRGLRRRVKPVAAPAGPPPPASPPASTNPPPASTPPVVAPSGTNWWDETS
ncbi:restriction endonuclease [Micromonospora sp. NBC_01392]|uniref:restriction endonuclease n=1 Tax=Micromonospora sp. NBC_01392 TaxID=2903588 RepID=UPI00325490C6